MKLFDGHAHIGSKSEREVRRIQNIHSLICASTPEEAIQLEAICKEEDSSVIHPTFGLHPWQAERYSFQDMEPWLLKTSIVGEIGMDSVWCSVPLSSQEKILCAQLELASDQKKPVILHTKGQETQIARLLRRYDNTYLVHWYSGTDGLSDFLDLDCYFTIGPDVFCNPEVRRAALLAPENRLLVETDGISAVQWAYENAAEAVPSLSKFSLPPFQDIGAVLKRGIEETARLRGISAAILAETMEQNFYRFLGKESGSSSLSSTVLT